MLITQHINAFLSHNIVYIIFNDCYILFAVNIDFPKNIQMSVYMMEFRIKANVPPSNGLCKLLIGTFL